MEGKYRDMGLPAGLVTSTAATTTASALNGNISPCIPTNYGNSEPAVIARPEVAIPVPNIEMTPSSHGVPFPANRAPNSSPYFKSPSSPFILSMSSAIVPISTGGFTFMNSSPQSGFESMKKKRGRPRKYGSDGSLALTVAPISSFSPSPSSPSHKRGRGRPPGSGKNQQLAALGELMLGSIGAGFTPHAITIATGEDIASRIMSFSQQGPRGICILAANGAISSVTLRQPSISGGIVTYEGRFEILSLSGSFLLTDLGGTRTRTGSLSVSLAGPDGRVVGGGIAGVLIAASPVQVVVGSFLCNSKKAVPKNVKTQGSAGLPKPMDSSPMEVSLSMNVGQPGSSVPVAEAESKAMVEDQTSTMSKGPVHISNASHDIAASNTHDKDILPAQSDCSHLLSGETKPSAATPLPNQGGISL
ncbi:hypothetical protein KP509_04G012000 [Ceratopteris richardii]|uniref:AT-hook motif nuclear-localized protein n=1 Tax=Ceratopteris richardii TaxID=49495 RepID=A0A8T2UUD1_CERRI|nr:hypothetical protein KP509_04G012000 [Ceratopteris richardii]KAH7438358.1 hypothetical protein KP509_04G012000 [Ceratopteris richardii]